MAYFEILRGLHSEGDKTYGPISRKRDPGTGQIIECLTEGTVGCVIETDVDLEARFNCPGSHKFRRISRAKAQEMFRRFSPDQVQEDEDLEALTVQQLREIAEAEELEVEPGAKKTDLIEAIRSARGSGAANPL